MKFTPTTTYLRLANAMGRTMNYTLSMRVANSLSESLSVADWTDVTTYIPAESFTQIGSRIEYNIGQFTTDSLTIKAQNISYWKTTFFTDAQLQATASYVEAKINLTLSNGTLISTDVVNVFAGFVDTQTITMDELEDSVEFTLYTGQDLAKRIGSENVTTRYLNFDVRDNASYVTGSILKNIPYVYIVSGNLPTYPMQPGIHTLKKKYNNSTHSLTLDSGLEIIVNANGQYTIGNNPTQSLDTQRLLVEVTNFTGMTLDPEVSEDLITINYGEQYPHQWYRNLGVQDVLQNIGTQMGISSFVFDDLQIDAVVSASKISFIDAPPNNQSIFDRSYAMETSGSNILIAIGNKVFSRTFTQWEQGTYTLLTSVAVGNIISRMIYNARNNHLWIIYGQVTTPSTAIARYDCTSTTLDTHTFATTPNYNSPQLVDYNYSGGFWKYGIILPQSATGINWMDGQAVSLSETQLFDSAYLGYPEALAGPVGIFSFKSAPSEMCYHATHDLVNYNINKVLVNGSGTWVTQSAAVVSSVTPIIHGIYIGTGRLYGSDNNTKVFTYVTTSNSTTTLNTFSGVCSSFVYDAFSTKTYYTIADTSPGVPGYYIDTNFSLSLTNNKLYSVIASTPVLESTGVFSPYTANLVFDYKLYGINYPDLILYKYDSKINLFVNEAKFPNSNLSDAFDKVLTGFNLIGNINGNKSVLVYRRGDSSGNPVGSGYSLTAGTDYAGTLQKSDPQVAFNWISLSNGTQTVTYDGTNYNTSAQFGAKKITMTNDLLPAYILYDLATIIFRFFNKPRMKYNISIANRPHFQLEPNDSITMNFTTTKIQSSATGIIYAIMYNADGSVDVELLA